MEENRSLLNNFGMDPEGSNQLLETARWAKLSAVLALVGAGLFLLFMTFAWSVIMEALNAQTPGFEDAGAGVVLVVIILIALAIATVLLVFLLKGATRIKQGILNKDQVLFNSGLANMKNYFVMLGVLTVLQFVFFLIGLVGGR